jgi:homoserine trans-succinylase
MTILFRGKLKTLTNKYFFFLKGHSKEKEKILKLKYFCAIMSPCQWLVKKPLDYYNRSEPLKKNDCEWSSNGSITK